MKTKFFMLLIMIASTQLSTAQCLPQGSMNVALGYGFGNFTKSLFKTYETIGGYKAKSLGPLHAKFEYMASEKFGIGLSVNYFNLDGSYDITYQNTSGATVNGREGLKYSTLSFLARGNYYWFNEDKVAVYSGIGLGYRLGDWSYYSDAPMNTNTHSLGNFPFGMEVVGGVKALITPNIGAYAEVGMAKSIAQVGLLFSFGGSSDRR
jgi:opacity protein-like surface antigen